MLLEKSDRFPECIRCRNAAEWTLIISLEPPSTAAKPPEQPGSPPA